MRYLLILLCLSAVAAPAAQFEIDIHERALLDATNKERRKAGLPELKAAPLLFQAARSHSENMARQNLLSHQLDGDGVDDRVKAAGYKYFNVGENIGWNAATPEAQVEGWMKSPGHRANILSPEFTEIGAGIARNESGEPYYTQVFGRPQSAGAPHRATISIENRSSQDVRISRPDGKGASLLQPRMTGQYHAEGGAALPPLTVSAGADRKQLPLRDGVHYVIDDADGGGIEVSTEREGPR